jgi:hypothetical protein
VIFPFFWSFLGRKPPCCDVWFVRSGRGGALHVSCILSEIFCIRWSNIVHVVSHCSLDSWFCFNVFVSSFNCGAFSSKNSVLNFSIFVRGMGFRILGGLSVVGGSHRASSVFGGMCSVTGEWSELRLWALFVVDVYRVLLGVLM